MKNKSKKAKTILKFHMGEPPTIEPQKTSPIELKIKSLASVNNTGSVSCSQDLCNALKNLDDSKLEDLKIRKNAATSQPEVQCFMQNLADFLEVSNLSLKYFLWKFNIINVYI